MKRSITQTRERQLFEAFEQLSKAALFDLVVDLVRQQRGEEHLDGPALIEALVERYEPIRVARGDRPLRVADPGHDGERGRTRVLELAQSVQDPIDRDYLLTLLRREGWRRGDADRAIRALVVDGALHFDNRAFTYAVVGRGEVV